MSYNVEGLEFLKDCTNEELGVLVDFIKDTGGFTETMTNIGVYCDNYPNHRAYVDLIQREIIDFGYDSLKIFGDRSYKEVVKKVCMEMNVYDSSDNMYEMENKILGKVFHDRLDEMSEEDKKAILKNFNLNDIRKSDSLMGFSLMGLFSHIFRINIAPLFIANILLKISGPNYKVVGKAVSYIAYLRHKHGN